MTAPEATSPTKAQSRLRFVLLYFAAWTPLWVIQALGLALTQRATPRSTAAPRLSPGSVIWYASIIMLVVAVCGLPVWPLSGYLERRGRWRFTIVTYAVAGVVFSVAVSLLTQGFIPMARPNGYQLDFVHLAGPYFLYIILLIAILAVRNFMRAERNRRAVIVAEQARAEANAMRTRAELQALRAHLDPHFLFNTLNAIAAIVETDPKQARQMLVRAGALLRRILDLGASGRDTITVEDEMSIVSEYLAFERLRMGDRLRIEADVTDEALDCQIPAFTIQPLVENAIRHGLFPIPSGGLLRVTGKVRDQVLRLEVFDTGAGADPQVLEDAKGFGLRATRQRIAGAYGGAAKVEVKTAPGKGFSVCLTLPVADEPVRA